MIYKFRPGSRIGGVDAQTAGNRLELLRNENGGDLTPQIIVDDAKPKRSALHKAFQWDDTVAAGEFRKDQARHLVRSISVVMEDRPESSPVRAFVSIRQSDNEENSYTSVRVAMSDDNLRAQVIAHAMGEAKAFQEKYRELSELAEIFEAIEKTSDRLSEEMIPA